MADRIVAVGELMAWAVRSGRFSADRVPYWTECYLADPAGTTGLIESLAPILASSESRWLAAAAARDTSASDDADAFAGLFPGWWEYDPRARAAQVEAMSDEELDAELFGPDAEA